jgi:hypothetical protein
MNIIPAALNQDRVYQNVTAAVSDFYYEVPRSKLAATTAFQYPASIDNGKTSPTVFILNESACASAYSYLLDSRVIKTSLVLHRLHEVRRRWFACLNTSLR